ncbi:hypothetical protein BGX23_011942 [Mortierella sp. AD031]|nr:hypothetical protein BGX23_011942 [Mortierella sp. AD031]
MDATTLPLYHQRALTPPSTATLPPGPGRLNSLAFFSSLSTSSSNDQSPKTFLPRTALRNSPDHSTNFQQLLFLRERFHKNEFWDEVAILDRMHYKNKNQHRQAGYFQRLCECRRIVARIKELNVAGLVDEFVQKFYSGRRAFYQLMSKTQFMAFALIAIGLCSRLSLLSKAWAKEYVDCYRLLEAWMKTFPKEEARVEDMDYESQLPESIDSVLVSSAPDIPDTQLPSTPSYQALNQSSRITMTTVAVAGSDLGEVIQRKELTISVTTAPPPPPSSGAASPKPSSARKHKLSSRSPSPEPERIQDQQSKGSAKAETDPHSNLLGELNTIFGSKPSSSSSSLSNSKKQEKKALPDLNDIFKSKKKQKSKDKKSSASGTSVSNSTAGSGSMPSSPLTGKNADKSNKVRKDKKEIDDIFGSIKKPKKKPAVSEIDSIFGPPKKKKMAP